MADKYVSVDGYAGDGTITNPWSLGEALVSVAPGDVVNMKSGTYLTTDETAFSIPGTSAAAIIWRGYVNTPGDAEVPVVIIDIQDNDAFVIRITGSFQRFEYIEARNNPNQEQGGWRCDGAQGVYFYRCRAELIGHTAFSVNFASGNSFGSSFFECEATDWGHKSTSTMGFNVSGGHNNIAIGCIAHNGLGRGFAFNQTGVSGAINCISAHNGTWGIHINKNVQSEYLITLHGVVLYKNASGGLLHGGTTADGNVPIMFANCIIAENGNYGIQSDASGTGINLINTAFFNNTMGPINLTNVNLWEPQDRITLTADPFIDPSSTALDFRLNSTASQLLGTGSPRQFLINGELTKWDNFLDIGAVQSQTSTINAANLSADAANKIADHVLRRSSVTMETSTTGDTLDLQSLYGAVARLTNKMEATDTTLTIFKADLYEELGTQTLTQAPSANPVDSVD